MLLIGASLHHAHCERYGKVWLIKGMISERSRSCAFPFYYGLSLIFPSPLSKSHLRSIIKPIEGSQQAIIGLYSIRASLSVSGRLLNAVGECKASGRRVPLCRAICTQVIIRYISRVLFEYLPNGETMGGGHINKGYMQGADGR